MKPLNKPERWYAFLEIIYQGDCAYGLPLCHIDYGFLSDTDIPHKREEAIDKYILELWENPPETL